MKAKKENKYLMMKIKDVENYFSQFTKGVFTTAEEQAVIEQEPFWKVVNELEKQNKNNYIIFFKIIKKVSLQYGSIGIETE